MGQQADRNPFQPLVTELVEDTLPRSRGSEAGACEHGEGGTHIICAQMSADGGPHQAVTFEDRGGAVVERTKVLGGDLLSQECFEV